jgi:outer membrane protein assembly factor BamB
VKLLTAIATATSLAAVVGCTPLPANVDALSAVDRGEIGLPVLSFDWKFTVVDRTREPKPQEFASAAESHGRLFIGSNEGTFYSLDASNGAIAWKIDLGAVSTRPVVDRGRIYVGTNDGTMVCLDTFDGSERWRYATRGPIMQPPVLAGDLVFFSNEADQVYALDQDTGKFRWQHRLETPEEYTIRGHAGVAVSSRDKLVFSGFANGTMVALRTTTGSVTWMTALAGEADRFVDVDGTPIVSGDTVFVTSTSGGVYALDKTTGLVRWRLPIEGAGGLVTDGELLYVAAANAGIHAIDHSGNIVWRQGTRGGGEPAQPVLSGDYLMYALSDDGLFIADKRTGVVHQYFDPGDGVSSQPTLVKDRVYVLSNRGTLFAMDMRHFDD